MGDDVEACMRALEDTHSSSSYEFHILERIGMSFTVQNAIVNAPNLTRFKVAGELPELHVNFSDRKYQALMKFIDVSIPKFEGDQTQQEHVTPTTAAQGRRHFGQREIEEYNFEDDRSIISARTTEERDTLDDGSSNGDKGDRFYEAHDQQTEVSSFGPYHRQLILMKYRVKKVLFDKSHLSFLSPSASFKHRCSSRFRRLRKDLWRTLCSKASVSLLLYVNGTCLWTYSFGLLPLP